MSLARRLLIGLGLMPLVGSSDKLMRLDPVALPVSDAASLSGDVLG